MKKRDFIISSLVTILQPLLAACGKNSKASKSKNMIKNNIQLDEIIKRHITANHIVGCVIIAAKSGEIIYQSAHGFSNRENQIKMKIDDQFRYASISKVFTHAAILRLIDDDKINANQDVRDFLPDFAPKLPDGKTPKITISQLLSHTAGLNYDFNQTEFGSYFKANISSGLDNNPITLEQNIKNINNVPLEYTPGKAWNYSIASDVLGAVIEKITGQKLSDSIDNIINQPLSLKTPAFSAPKDSIVPAYYNAAPEPIKMNGQTDIKLFGRIIRMDSNRIYNENAFQSGGAGMKGNAQDFVKLLEAIRTGDFISNQTRNHAKTAIVSENPKNFGAGWGFGWLFTTLIKPSKSALKFGKSTLSWGGVYGHSWLLDFENELSLVILTNTAFEGMNGKFKEDIFKYASDNFI